jgi:hypothetical protein
MVSVLLFCDAGRGDQLQRPFRFFPAWCALRFLVEAGLGCGLFFTNVSDRSAESVSGSGGRRASSNMRNRSAARPPGGSSVVSPGRRMDFWLRDLRAGGAQHSTVQFTCGDEN